VQVKRVEKHIINKQNKFYQMLREKCHIAKNIYNHGNYLIRQEFTKNNKYLKYEEVEKLMKTDIQYPDYWDLGLANSSQQILRVLDKNWKSFFKSIKDYKVNPTKYNGKPKLPKYLKKDSFKEFALTTNQVKLKADNLIHFPKSMNEFTINPRFIILNNFVKLNQCRIIPKHDRIIVELVYTIEIEEKKNIFEDNIASIDLGIDNFATIVTNTFVKPIIINGKGLKSCNQYFNKQLSKIQSSLILNNNQYTSHGYYRILNKREDKIENFMYKVSNFVINFCLKHKIGTLIVGKNDGWKQFCNLGKRNNQHFSYIPYNTFISKLKYKCEEVGIKLILVNESYTSGTSFLDNEFPNKKNYDKIRRIHRGLFKSNTGKLINADVNAAYQIIKKVFRNAAPPPANSGCVMNPVRISIDF
jgi:putative transposase